MTRTQAEALATELSDAYRRAWVAISVELDSIATDPAWWAKRNRLQALQREVERMMKTLDKRALEWVSATYPTIYRDGALSTLQRVDESFVWTLPHRSVIEALGQQTYDGLLAATTGTVASTKRLVRELARSGVLDKLVQGQTAVQAARVLRRQLEANRVHAITYANGARHNLADYTDMLLRTQTALAYNQGALNAGRTFGWDTFEVFDGLGCGWTSHSDPTPANGKIVQAKDAILLAHPRCRRAFGVRPDLSRSNDLVGSATA